MVHCVLEICCFFSLSSMARCMFDACQWRVARCVLDVLLCIWSPIAALLIFMSMTCCVLDVLLCICHQLLALLFFISMTCCVLDVLFCIVINGALRVCSAKAFNVFDLELHGLPSVRSPTNALSEIDDFLVSMTCCVLDVLFCIVTKLNGSCFFNLDHLILFSNFSARFFIVTNGSLLVSMACCVLDVLFCIVINGALRVCSMRT